MDELIQTVAWAAGLSPEQATLAVAAMLRFIPTSLPSVSMGGLQAHLGLPKAVLATLPISIATSDYDPN